MTLLIRFSALGDILMMVPVVDALAHQYPQEEFIVVSRPYVQSIFKMLPGNVRFHGVNPRNYHGLKGLRTLYKELQVFHPSRVCDLHDVIRTKVIRTFFQMAGVPTTHIIKDRAARRAFITSKKKVQQMTSFERYQDALSRLGFPVQIDWAQRFSLCKEKHTGGIGIAPFAAHEGKIYPLDKMEKVVELLSMQGRKVYLFGAGASEKELMESWEKKYDGATSMVGNHPNMGSELRLMSSLDVMLTMDSGNMHLASLAGVRVISIWGATHPLGGFLGWGQSLEDVIQKDFSCRPCSIFGNKPCRYRDYRCLNTITPEDIVRFLNKA